MERTGITGIAFDIDDIITSLNKLKEQGASKVLIDIVGKDIRFLALQDDNRVKIVKGDSNIIEFKS